MTDEKYFKLYIAGTFKPKDGQPVNLQSYHHHVNQRMHIIGLASGLISGYLLNLMQLQKELPEPQAERLGEIINLIEKENRRVQR